MTFKDKNIRAIHVFLFLLCLVSSCSKRDNELGKNSMIYERYPQKIQDSLLDEAIVKAEKYCEKEEDKEIFVYNFFRGYIHGLEQAIYEVIISGGEGISQKGFNEGQFFFETRHKTGTQNLTLEDLDYKYITVKGIYKQGFEVSDFRQNWSLSNWWLEFQKGVLEGWIEKNGDVDPEKKYKCCIKGYLVADDPGGFGHLGMYDRKFIVSEIVEMK